MSFLPTDVPLLSSEKKLSSVRFSKSPLVLPRFKVIPINLSDKQKSMKSSVETHGGTKSSRPVGLPLIRTPRCVIEPLRRIAGASPGSSANYQLVDYKLIIDFYQSCIVNSLCMVTIQQQPYADYMKDVISFCEFACLKYHIPILLINSAVESFSVITRIISSLESPVAGNVFIPLLPLRLKKLEKATLYIADQKHFTQEELMALDTRDAKIVIIDDLAAVPSIDVLNRWADEKGLIIIARKD